MNEQIRFLFDRFLVHIGVEFVVAFAAAIIITLFAKRDRLRIFFGLVIVSIVAIVATHMPPSSSVIKLLTPGLGHIFMLAGLSLLLWIAYFPFSKSVKHPNLILLTFMLIFAIVWTLAAFMLLRRSGPSAQEFLYRHELARLKVAVETEDGIYEALDSITYRASIKGPEVELKKYLVRSLAFPEGRSQARAADILADMAAVDTLPALIALLTQAVAEDRSQIEVALDRLSVLPEAYGILEEITFGGHRKLKPEALRLIAKHHYEAGEKVFMNLMVSDDPLLRSLATRLLGVFSDMKKSEKVVKGLERALRDRNPDVRSAAVETIETLADSLPARKFMTTSVYIDLLEDKEISHRRAAAHILGLLRSRKAAPALVKALKSDDKGLKLNALMALGRIKEPSTIVPVSALLSDSEPDVRLNSLKTIRQIAPRDLSLDSPALTALKRLIKRETSFDVKVEAALTACWLDLEEAMGYISDLDVKKNVKDKKRAAAPPTESELAVKFAALECMKMLGDEAAVNYLVNMFDETIDEVRNEAIEALIGIGDPSAIPDLKALLNHESRDTRALAEKAIEILNEAIPVAPVLPATPEIELEPATNEVEFLMEGIE